MNNKNEKTFSDLFLNSKDNDGVNEQKITFDTLSSDAINEPEEKVKDVVSFGSFSDVANNDIISDSLNNSMDKSDNDLLDVKSQSVFDMALNDISDIMESNSSEMNKVEEFQEKVSTNMFDLEETEENNFTEVNNVQETQEEISTNLFDLGVTNNVEETEENNFTEVNKVQEIQEEISTNLFGLGDTSNVEAEENNSIEVKEKQEEGSSNIFGLGEINNVDIEENNSTEVNEVQEDTKNNTSILNETKIDNEQVSGLKDINGYVVDTAIQDSNKLDSPFFEASTDAVDDNFSPLFSNSISLEQVDNSQKSIGKINLNGTKHFDVKIQPKKEPLTKFIIGVISYAFFIWLLLIGITLLVYVLDIKIRAAKGDYSAPVFNAYVVLTGSMLPDIQVNDVVVTKKVDAKDLEVGDIITFASADTRFSGTIITHRIIKKNPATDQGGITFQTKGDNNNVADSSLVPESNIYGKVILKIPKLGYLQEFLASDGGWILVILIPCLTVISYDIVKLIKGLKRKKTKSIKVKK